jgi:site-specific recombinase XerD
MDLSPVPDPDDYDLLVASWRRHLRGANLSEATIRLYLLAATYFGAFLREQNAPRTVAAIRAEHIRAWLAYLREKPHRYSGAPLAAKTLSTYYTALEQFFAWLADADAGAAELPASPMAHVRRPLVPVQPVPAYPTERLAALHDYLQKDRTHDGRRDLALFRLFLDTGIRLEEGARLTLADVSDAALDAGELSILGKGRRRRSVPLSAETVDALSAYRLIRRKHDHHAAEGFWLGMRGALTPHGLYQVMCRWGPAVGLEHFHPHRLRHEAARLMLTNGMNADEVMHVCGWRSIAIAQAYVESSVTQRSHTAHHRASPVAGLAASRKKRPPRD